MTTAIRPLGILQEQRQSVSYLLPIQVLLLGGLFMLVTLSAFNSITVKHMNRTLMQSLDQLNKVSIEQEQQHGKLLLERATLTHQDRIFQYAKHQLAMQLPS